MPEYTVAINIGGVQVGVVTASVNELTEQLALLEKNRERIAEQLGVQDSAPAAEDMPQNEAETAPKRVDPWSGDPVPDDTPRRSAARSAPSRGTSGGGSGSAQGTRQDTDRFGNRWTFGLPDAPDCDGLDKQGNFVHEPHKSARVNGTSQQGRKYTAFKCADGGPGGDWRNKCDFFQYPD